MFTTGSKLLIGSALLATIATIAYGIAQGGTLGTIGLASAATALWFLAGVNIYVRDCNVAIDEAGALTVSAAARQAPPSSPWPIVGALGAAALLLSVVTYPAVGIAGLVLLLAATAEWMVQAWSERGSADAAYNDEIRARLAHPLEMPILGVIGAGVIIYSFSRVMLSLTKVGTTVTFSVLAALVLFVAFMFAARPKVSSGTIGGVVGLAVVALVAGGAVAAFSGERDMHVIETTADLAERGRCGTEASEADKKSSQTLAGKTNLAATLTLDDAGILSAEVPGFNESTSRLTLPRSNPNNVVFRNDSDTDRRLVIDVGPSGDMESRTLCTALVEPGGVQFLTVIFDMPTFAVPDGHRFTVPGVESAVVEVTVP
ncbi:MAG: hypothetical protein EA389_03995 [Ilumatobacter sp.]|nr:MAG: hypothetical protein EA389_03995 [Ilumatobacter sp.]